MTRVPPGKEWLTVPQVARILDVNKQAIYDAVKDGRLEARGSGVDRRIHAREVVGYAIRSERDVDAVLKGISDVAGEIEWKVLLGWVLAAVGLYWLFTKLNEK